MTSINNVQNIPSIETKPKETVAKKQGTSSIFDAPQIQNNQQTTENSSIKTPKIDKLLEKLCVEFSKYNLTVEQLKQIDILSKISGKTNEQLEKVTEEELNRIYDALKSALKDSIENGEINLKKAIKLGIDYHTALFGGWKTIDAFKNANKKNNEDLSARMERFFGLKKGSFATLPEEKVEEYLERYFNQYFLDKVKHSKNPKETYRLQLRDFTKLLINTPDSEKAIFKQALLSLAESNKLKGLDAVFMSFESEEACTGFANICDSEFEERFLTKPDIEGNIPTKEEGTAIIARITSKKDAEHIESDFKANDIKAKKFFDENKEKLTIIKEKLEKGEALNEEEKKLLIMNDYFTSVKAGEMSGTALNQIIEASVKECLLTEMNDSAYNLPNYTEILEQLTEYIENNPDQYPCSKEELIELLNKVTNGNYTEYVNNGSNGNFNPPATQSTETSNNNTAFGFSQTSIDYNESKNNIEQFKNKHKEENAQITIEKNNTDSRRTSIKEKSIESLSEKDIIDGVMMRLFTLPKIMSEIGNNFTKAKSSVKNMFLAYMDGMSDSSKALFLRKINSDNAKVEIIKNAKFVPDEKMIEQIKETSNYYATLELEKIEKQENDNNIA